MVKTPQMAYRYIVFIYSLSSLLGQAMQQCTGSYIISKENKLDLKLESLDESNTIAYFQCWRKEAQKIWSVANDWWKIAPMNIFVRCIYFLNYWKKEMSMHTLHPKWKRQFGTKTYLLESTACQNRLNFEQRK